MSTLALLRSVPLATLVTAQQKCASRRIVTIDSCSTVPAAFQRLLRECILGAPVYDCRQRAYTGVLELSDLLPFLVDRYSEAEAIAVVARAYDTTLMKPTKPAAHPTAPNAATNPKATKTAAQSCPKTAGTAAAAAAGTAAASVTAPSYRSGTEKGVTPDMTRYIEEIFSSTLHGATEAGVGSATTSVVRACAEGSAQTNASAATKSCGESTSDEPRQPSVVELSRNHPLKTLTTTDTLWDAVKLLSESAHRLCAVCYADNKPQSPIGDRKATVEPKTAAAATTTTGNAAPASAAAATATVTAAEVINSCRDAMQRDSIALIITRSTLIRFLAALLNAPTASVQLKRDFANRLEIGSSPVVTVLDSARTIDAFRRMADCDITGLAVVDRSRMYLGQLQNTHLKMFLNSSVYFEAPVCEFLRHLHESEAAHRTTPSMQNSTLVTNTLKTPSLAILIRRLAATGTRALYVCTPVKPLEKDAAGDTDAGDDGPAAGKGDNDDDDDDEEEDDDNGIDAYSQMIDDELAQSCAGDQSAKCCDVYDAEAEPYYRAVKTLPAAGGKKLWPPKVTPVMAVSQGDILRGIVNYLCPALRPGAHAPATNHKELIATATSRTIPSAPSIGTIANGETRVNTAKTASGNGSSSKIIAVSVKEKKANSNSIVLETNANASGLPPRITQTLHAVDSRELKAAVSTHPNTTTNNEPNNGKQLPAGGVGRSSANSAADGATSANPSTAEILFQSYNRSPSVVRQDIEAREQSLSRVSTQSDTHNSTSTGTYACTPPPERTSDLIANENTNSRMPTGGATTPSAVHANSAAAAPNGSAAARQIAAAVSRLALPHIASPTATIVANPAVDAETPTQTPMPQLPTSPLISPNVESPYLSPPDLLMSTPREDE